MSMSSAYWCTKPLWYVDPVAGNDEAEGDINTPIRSITALERRWNHGRILQVTDVNILGSLVANDQIKIEVDLGRSGLLRYKMVPTSLGTGTFSAVTNYPAAPTTLASVTDSARAVSGWAFAVGKKIRNTTTGAIAWVLADVGGGTGTALVSAWTNPSMTTLPIITRPPEVTASAGNTYSVEDLGQARVDVRYVCSFDRTVNVNDVFVAFDGFWFRNATDTHNTIDCRGSANGPNLIGCSLQTMYLRGGQVSGHVLQNCKIRHLGLSDGYVRAYAGHVESGAFVTATAGGRLAYDFNTIAYNAGWGLGQASQNGYIEINRAGSVNSQSSGVWCNATSVVATCGVAGANAPNPIFWGSGNAAYGIRNEGKFVWDTTASPTKPTVTGALGDMLLGGTVTPWSSLTDSVQVGGAEFVKSAST